MSHFNCLTTFNAWLVDCLLRAPNRRKARKGSHSGPETLEQRQLLVVNPTGLWNLTTNAEIGPGTVTISGSGTQLHFAGTFPEFFGGFDFAVDAKSTKKHPDHFKGKESLVANEGNFHVTVKYQIDFTSETTFTGTAKAKFPKQKPIAENVTGTKVVP